MANNKGEYQIRSGDLDVPTYAASGGQGLTLDAVKRIFSQLQPEYVEKVGLAYLAAAKALDTASDQLHEHARRITEVWGGENAQTALKQLGQLNTTAAELQEKSFQAGTPLCWLGSEILPWYKAEGEKMTDGYIHTDGDDDRAVEMLDRMDNRITQGYNSVPPVINKDLPPPDKEGGDLGTARGRATASTAGMGPSSSVPYSPSSSGTLIGSTDQPGAMPGGPGGQGDPALPASGGTDLAGMESGVGTDPFGAGGLSGGAGGLGGGAGGLGGGPPGAAIPGVIDPGRTGAQNAAGQAGKSKAAAGKPSQGSPMAGGAGHGGEEQERERTTWLTEDDDVWTDDHDVTPPVIE